MPPWWRGNHGGLYSKRCGSPERGDRLPQVSGIGGGRALLRTSAKNADGVYLCLRTWRFKGTKITLL